MPKSSRSVLTSITWSSRSCENTSTNRSYENTSSSRSCENAFSIAILKTLAVAAGMLFFAAQTPAYAGDWVEDKSADEFDLTAVPSLNGLNSKSSTGTTSSTGSSQSTRKKHAPYMMLSTPSTGSATSSSRSSSSASAPGANSKKSQEYDLEISSDDSANSSSPTRKKNILSRVAGGPAKALGVTCGVMVGVPVSIARDTRKYTGQMKKSMNDGLAVEQTGDLTGHFWAGASAVPFGIGSGLVHGSVTGFQRALEHGKAQPFSKESMSLGAKSRSLSNRPDGADNN